MIPSDQPTIRPCVGPEHMGGLTGGMLRDRCDNCSSVILYRSKIDGELPVCLRCYSIFLQAVSMPACATPDNRWPQDVIERIHKSQALAYARDLMRCPSGEGGHADQDRYLIGVHRRLSPDVAMIQIIPGRLFCEACTHEVDRVHLLAFVSVINWAERFDGRYTTFWIKPKDALRYQHRELFAKRSRVGKLERR